MNKIASPAEPKSIRNLRIGDRVSISGIIVTGRDEAHKYLIANKDDNIANLLKDSFIYHCGPIVRKSGKEYEIVSCGPTTSIREEPYQAKIIKDYGVKGIIGKGGMGVKTLEALKECGAVYLQATGGAAALLAKSIDKVIGVHFLDEFGVPEAMWVLSVKDFPAIVTMDSHGGSLHEKVYDESFKNYKRIMSL